MRERCESLRSRLAEIREIFEAFVEKVYTLHRLKKGREFASNRSLRRSLDHSSSIGIPPDIPSTPIGGIS